MSALSSRFLIKITKIQNPNHSATGQNTGQQLTFRALSVQKQETHLRSWPSWWSGEREGKKRGEGRVSANVSQYGQTRYI